MAGVELQENLGQEMQEMIEDGQSCQSRAGNLQGLAGRIEPAGAGGGEGEGEKPLAGERGSEAGEDVHLGEPLAGERGRR